MKPVITKIFNSKFENVSFTKLPGKKILMIKDITNKIIIILKWRKCNNLFKPLTKRNVKYIKFNLFFYNYCTHNNNEIISWQDIAITVNIQRLFPLSIMKNSKSFSVMSSIFWTCCKNLSLVKFTIIEFPKLNLVTRFFVFFPIN